MSYSELSKKLLREKLSLCKKSSLYKKPYFKKDNNKTVKYNLKKIGIRLKT